jgi:hypothetical protein
LRRIAVVVVALWLTGGLAWASWKLLTPAPLLSDDFNSNWGDTRIWDTPRRTIRVEDGHVRIFDRGYLVTRDEFAAPIDVRFRWQWIDLAGDLRYRDVLTVALRTEGIPSEARPYEITNGIIVQLAVHGGDVVIGSTQPGVKEHAVFARTPKGSIPMPVEQWMDVRITDDGETVAVYLSGPGRGPDSLEVPVLQAKVGQPIGPGKIAFYNRERLASASHESWIDDVVIRRLER